MYKMRKGEIMAKKSLNITIAAMLLIPAFLIWYKVVFLGYTLASIIPQVNYEITLKMSYDGFGEPVEIRTYLPAYDDRQSIMNETNASPGSVFEIRNGKTGRMAVWTAENPKSAQNIEYSFTAYAEHVKYEIEKNTSIPAAYPAEIKSELAATDSIQINDPVITAIHEKHMPKTRDLQESIKAAYDYAHALKPRPFKGMTDAVTAAKLGEASCNGKSRLFAALLRKSGVPVRLAGGIIMSQGTKKTSHQWAEAYINGYWVPFDTLNGHYAEIPENYLKLYTGDEPLFVRNAGINFKYAYKTKKAFVSNTALMPGLQDSFLNAYNVWEAFGRIGVPRGLLKIIIMMPLGAFIIVIFRNVIGFQTFGTFLPALIAAASRETGFGWGLLGFICVILLVSLLHYPLDAWGILHTPKMGILLVSVVACICGLTVLGVKLELYDLSYMSLFPLAILTITAERFAITQTEEGLPSALKVMFMTVVAMGFCYLAMNSLAMESMFLAFPELFLVLIALNLWLGRWIGVRVTELNRFKWLVQR